MYSVQILREKICKEIYHQNITETVLITCHTKANKSKRHGLGKPIANRESNAPAVTSGKSYSRIEPIRGQDTSQGGKLPFPSQYRPIGRETTAYETEHI
ncbi:hypothetical protein E2C01_045788 [Portunus trituberculatus]|uniref:Uncharacterized protein n=1 Tax=Portunus trituberculatus TaxID=210409 RepID=A0A5B7FWP9_PORTR|nr:hypothetical protein [Portunus trituberculatus]